MVELSAKILVSFVIPVLDGEADIARCLISIRNQKFLDGAFEVLIIDNGSTDRTHQIIRDLGFDFQVVPGVAIGALRNSGAAMAQGDYLAFVDSDMELPPHWLQNGMAGFKDHKVVASGCFPHPPKEATWVQQAWELQRCCRRSEVRSIPVRWLSSMNLLVRRNDFLAVGGFNERLKTAEDVDLGYRLGRCGTILYNPAMKAVHWGEANDLKSFWRKEVWRGTSNLKGVFSHGLCWDELPSLGYPLYVLCLVVFIGLGFCIDLRRQQPYLVPIGLALLFLPALLLALDTARLAKRPGSIPQLFLLYFIYGCARAYSVVKI